MLSYVGLEQQQQELG